MDVHDQIGQRRRERKAHRVRTGGHDIKSSIGAPLEQQSGLIGHAHGWGTFRAVANPQFKYVPTAYGRQIDRQSCRDDLTVLRINSPERFANRNIARLSAANCSKRQKEPDCDILGH